MRGSITSQLEVYIYGKGQPAVALYISHSAGKYNAFAYFLLICFNFSMKLYRSTIINAWWVLPTALMPVCSVAMNACCALVNPGSVR